jgi:hypothetical protein
MDYARQYGSLVPLSEALRIFVYKAGEVIVTSWSLCALAGIQLILVLPAVSLLAGAAIAEADHLLVHRARSIRIFALVIAAGAMGLQVFRERELLFRIPVDSIPRYVYGLSPFAESIPIAKYLREHTTPNDTIAILGSEPQIYFYSNRHSATGYIYTYGLMEPQKYAEQMQREMIREIEVARPKYLIIIAMEDSWTRWHDSKLEIFD